MTPRPRRRHLPLIRVLTGLVASAAIAAASGCAVAPAGSAVPAPPSEAPFIVVLGVAQDAGYPQTACRKPCCEPAWADASRRRLVSCLGLVDPTTGSRWLLDATPDLREQLRRLDAVAPPRDVSDRSSAALDGILLTHAHVGHYTGLQDLGREITGADGVPVHAMPRMRAYLAGNGPWSQLVALGNITLRPLAAGAPVELAPGLRVTPIRVPHRDEFSETVAFRVDGPDRSALFVPDIDKWSRWDRRLEDELRSVDVAYLDGTFFADGEIPGRAMDEIPHPFIEETMARLAALPAAERAKVRFIHLNHTNPALDPRSAAAAAIRAAGFDLAVEGRRFDL